MDTDLYFPVENFIDAMQSEVDDHPLICDIKWIAKQEGTTPKQVLWRVEAQVGQRVAETRRRLQKLLEEE